jgi:hypothetical protein
MAFSANRAAREDLVASDTQQRFQFNIDPDIDIPPAGGADEMQPFHGGLRVRYGSDESGLHIV